MSDTNDDETDGCFIDLINERGQLRARVRELEAENLRVKADLDAQLYVLTDERSRLATATALIGQWLESAQRTYPTNLAAASRDFVANAPGAPVYRPMSKVEMAQAAILAGQPAAPRCEGCGTIRNLRKSDHAGWLCADPACQPAAPTRTEAKGPYVLVHKQMLAQLQESAKSEQRVLKP